MVVVLVFVLLFLLGSIRQLQQHLFSSLVVQQLKLSFLVAFFFFLNKKVTLFSFGFSF
jgi:hypothetical protein